MVILQGYRKGAFVGLLSFLLILLYTQGNLTQQDYTILLFLSVVLGLLVQWIIERTNGFNNFVERNKAITAIVVIALIFLLIKQVSPLFASSGNLVTRLIGGGTSVAIGTGASAILALGSLLAGLETPVILLIFGVLAIIIGIPLILTGVAVSHFISANGTLLAILLAIIVGGFVIIKLFKR